MPSVAVCAAASNCLETAENLADRLQLSHVAPGTKGFDFLLCVTVEGLVLESCRSEPPGRVIVDFLSGALGYRIKHACASRQPLARALGYRRQNPFTVIDATAGLGRDAMLLATLGCRVTLLERSAVVCALLEDGLRRAAKSDRLGAIVKDHVGLHCADATPWLDRLKDSDTQPDAIYLDPMFPARTKTSLVRKEMRTLRALLGDGHGSEALLHAAIGCAVERVAVKRPPGAPPLAGLPPDLTYPGKRARFDVYLARRRFAPREDGG
ncbi:MAG: class I SAM-dependent methyltransferase [Pseudomonadota bacterium]|nr:class I SAM-dependent methyltransferase [Pseudomonadota bacterium]